MLKNARDSILYFTAHDFSFILEIYDFYSRFLISTVISDFNKWFQHFNCECTRFHEWRAPLSNRVYWQWLYMYSHIMSTKGSASLCCVFTAFVFPSSTLLVLVHFLFLFFSLVLAMLFVTFTSTELGCDLVVSFQTIDPQVGPRFALNPAPVEQNCHEPLWERLTTFPPSNYSSHPVLS